MPPKTRPDAVASPPSSKLFLNDYLPYNMVVSASAISQQIARIYSDRFGLTLPQWRLIINLGSRGPMAQLQIVEHSALDKIAVSRAAAALRARGFVTMEFGRSDKRFRLLELTPTGRTIYREGATLALEIEQLLVSTANISDPLSLREQLIQLQKAARALEEF
ncbi:DNA-binding MarR family transcriptional regulator [Novosphingobium chloroacetimidivorans]|uniref:DNA-binding MarR family transcriptional regulator n=1 Tax=Novosphingobium chloroacetimidivorans TaxID=1428314 RepID=A0A7W7NYJ2_9SPHN|nr:MarR family winged helix-turn-helix transcriptional regulator [Novosphingobium chloroacetimidivorans]MBB4860285.1 DNA-binding MarR family transcriptional regulator [Novosphingobium chloroacetimidivorans]